jgi:hypothetical protein
LGGYLPGIKRGFQSPTQIALAFIRTQLLAPDDIEKVWTIQAALGKVRSSGELFGSRVFLDGNYLSRAVGAMAGSSAIQPTNIWASAILRMPTATPSTAVTPIGGRKRVHCAIGVA